MAMHPPWTDEEIKLLRAFYPHSHPNALAKLFPTRKPYRVRDHASRRCKLAKTKAYRSFWYYENFGYAREGRTRISQKGFVLVFLQNKWRTQHHVIWEQHHGPVPKGYALTFIDGNKQNTDIGNLMLMNKRQHFDRISFTNYPQELKQAIKLNKKILKEINNEQSE